MSDNENIPFTQGQKVIDKSDPRNIAEYTGKYRRIGSALTVEIKFPNGSTRHRPVSCVSPVEEGKTSSLLEQMQDELFGSLSDLRQLITYEKLKGSLHDVVYSM